MNNTATQTRSLRSARAVQQWLLRRAQKSPRIEAAETFAEAGVATRDHGVVLYTEDGRQYQITIVRSA